jgi:lactate permease
MIMTLILLSFLPVLLLVVLPLLKDVRFAAVATLIVTSILFFIWRSPPEYYLASLILSLVSTINILMIVFGAVLLFEMMNASGYINKINESIERIHPTREVRFFLVAIGLTGFFEGVSGFGTPGAIVPLLLISMGFNPLLSVISVLLIDGLMAAFGAVGTPLLAGLQANLKLTDPIIQRTAVYTSCMLSVAGIIIIWFIGRLYEKEENRIGNKLNLLFMFCSTFIPMVLFSFLWPEFSTILASVSMLLLCLIYFTITKTNKDKERRTFNISAWLPYLSLVALLLLPKIIHSLNVALDWELKWNAILSTAVTASLKPLKSPLIPFVIIAILFTRNRKHYYKSFTSAGKKLVSVSLLLFPIIAVAQLMLNSGAVNTSMIQLIARAFSKTGEIYVMLAPFVGITGTFITGSTTLSNIVFGSSQLETAQLLSIDPALVLSVQLAGASIGNAICLFNIIAACSVANIKETNKVLLKNFVTTIIAGLIFGVIAILIKKNMNEL